jgi:peptidyl-prolyl cis-trans isomerase D
MIRRKGLFVLLAAVSIAACESFKEAMTAHVDVAARAGTQELSSQRLADVLSTARVPLRKEVFDDFAKLWVDYQLVGIAAAHNDSLTDRKAIEAAAWGVLTQARLQKFYEQVSKSMPVDSASEAHYNEGRLLAARHILFLTPQQGATPAQVDSVRRVAEATRAKITPANFEGLARKSSQDPGSAQRGGLLPLFGAGEMVPEFEQATRALKPGEISGLVRTQYGFHIIERVPYAQVKDDFAKAWTAKARNTADSTYVAQLESAGKIEVKKDIATKVKAIANDPAAFSDDKTVLATSTAGTFTGASLVRWMKTLPPQARPQIAQAPDSVLPDFVKAMVRNDLMLKRADSLKINIDSTEMSQLYAGVRNVITQLWTALGVDPKSLADSGKTVTDREKIAGARIDRYLDELIAGKRQYVRVPDEIAAILRAKYPWKIVPQGIDRALERAQKLRAANDSTTKANQPQSAVPLPGGPPMGAPPAGAAPTTAPPVTTPKP